MQAWIIPVENIRTMHQTVLISRFQRMISFHCSWNAKPRHFDFREYDEDYYSQPAAVVSSFRDTNQKISPASNFAASLAEVTDPSSRKTIGAL